LPLLAAVILGGYVLMLDLQIVSVALPAIKSSFGVGLSALQWTVDAYALTLATTLLVAGGIADRYGLLRVYVIGVALAMVASLACAFSPTIAVLVALRALQGVGGGIVFSGGPALIAERLRGQARARAYTAYGLAIAVAFGTAPLIGGALLGPFGWRSVFYVSAVPMAVMLALLVRIKPAAARCRPHPIDWRAAVLFAASMAALTLGLIDVGHFGLDPETVWLPIAFGAAGLVAFARVDARTAQPLVELGLLRDRLFAAASIAAFALSAAIPVAVAGVSLYFQSGRGESGLLAGLAVAPLALGLLLGSGFSVPIERRIGPERLLFFGLLVMAAGFALLVLWSVGGIEVAEVAIGLTICGVGHGAMNPAIYGIASAVASPGRLGMASGLSNTFRQVGVAMGVALFGSVMAARVEGDADAAPAAYAAGLHDLFLGAGLLCLVAALAVWGLGGGQGGRAASRRSGSSGTARPQGSEVPPTGHLGPEADRTSSSVEDVEGGEAREIRSSPGLPPDRGPIGNDGRDQEAPRAAADEDRGGGDR
jgi:MFS family permease